MPGQCKRVGGIFRANVHLQLKVDEFFAVFREALRDLVHTRGLPRLDCQVFGLHALGGDFRLDGFGDLLHRQIQAVRDHGHRLRQADVFDDARFHLRVKFFDRHSRADFFLQWEPPLRGVHHAQPFGVLDAL